MLSVRNKLLFGLKSYPNLTPCLVKTFYSYSPEPSQPLNREPAIVSPEEAVKCIKSGNTVFMQGAAATPTILVKAMAEHGRNANLRDVKICAMHTEGLAEYTDPALEKVFRSTSFFMGGNVRKAVAEGRADCVPIFLHEIPQLFHKKIYCPDVALISVSPPDQHGYCSLGTSVDCVRAALMHSKCIVGN